MILNFARDREEDSSGEAEMEHQQHDGTVGEPVVSSGSWPTLAKPTLANLSDSEFWPNFSKKRPKPQRPKDLHSDLDPLHTGARPVVNGIHPAPDIHEHFMIYKGYGTLRTS